MLTNFQSKLLIYITEYLANHSAPPSFSEMTTAMQISPNSKPLITRSLRVLEKAGKVRLKKAGRRLDISLMSKKIPILGRISAGVPIEAIVQQRYLDFETLLEGENRFALQVKGDSMIEEGIFDGDLVICESAVTAREGKIIVALVDQQNVTLKRISYKAEKGKITLIPANSRLEPQVYSPDRVTIQGVYLGLVRM